MDTHGVHCDCFDDATRMHACTAPHCTSRTHARTCAHAHARIHVHAHKHAQHARVHCKHRTHHSHRMLRTLVRACRRARARDSVDLFFEGFKVIGSSPDRAPRSVLIYHTCALSNMRPRVPASEKASWSDGSTHRTHSPPCCSYTLLPHGACLMPRRIEQTAMPHAWTKRLWQT